MVIIHVPEIAFVACVLCLYLYCEGGQRCGSQAGVWRCPAPSGVAIPALPSSEKFCFECCCSICSCQSAADVPLGWGCLRVSCAPRALAELKVMKHSLKHTGTLVQAAAAGLGYMG